MYDNALELEWREVKYTRKRFGCSLDTGSPKRGEVIYFRTLLSCHYVGDLLKEQDAKLRDATRTNRQLPLPLHGYIYGRSTLVNC
jgi:hypothetical protein